MKRKIILIFIFLLVLFPFFSFAKESVQGGYQPPEIVNLLISLVNAIAVIWYVFPVLAGKLMTNDFVYGTFMHLDQVLWNIWNIMRSFANFIIGFIFIYGIFKLFVSSSDKGASVLKQYLPKLALATIAVNASWFLIGVLVDLSIILTAAFGTLPRLFSDLPVKDYAIPQTIQYSIRTAKEVKNFSQSIDSTVPGRQDVDIKKLLSYENSISGPLFFLGATIFDINNINKNYYRTAYNQDKKAFSSTGAFIRIFIQIMVLFLFLVPMIVLVVVNAVRLFWIWMWVAFSPLAFLDNIFGGKTLASKQKAFAFSNFLGLLFQPVLVVAAFSIGFIFISSVANFLIQGKGPKENQTQEQQVKRFFNMEKSSNGVVQTPFFWMQDTTYEFSRYVGGFFGWLFISMLTIIFVWMLIKLSFKASAITSGIADNMFDFAEKVAKSVPLPTPVGKLSVGALQQFSQRVQSIPATMAGHQAERLAKMFKTVPDVDSVSFQKFDRQLDLSRVNRDNNEISQMFEYFRKYQGKENLISENKNAKNLLDKIAKDLSKSGNPANIIKLGEKLSQGTYEDRLKELLDNIDTIENFIKKE